MSRHRAPEQPWHPPPLRQYGLLGDTKTAALTSQTGSIDWMCWPRFDSEPLFGRLIDHEHGGHFEIAVEGVTSTERRYRDRSTVLETTWETGTGRACLVEAMVMGPEPSVLVRRLSCTAGAVDVRVVYAPDQGCPARIERHPSSSHSAHP